MRVLAFLFLPDKQWEKLTAGAGPRALSILFFSVIPLLLISCAVEGYGIQQLGARITEFGRVRVPDARILHYLIVFATSSLLLLLVGALLLMSIGRSFSVQADYSAYFALLAYGYSPVILLHMLDAIPQVNTWICFAIGVSLGIRVLYHGVGLALRPEQTKGFGFFLISTVCLLIMSGLIHFISVQVLEGKLWNKAPTMAGFD